MIANCKHAPLYELAIEKQINLQFIVMLICVTASFQFSSLFHCHVLHHPRSTGGSKEDKYFDAVVGHIEDIIMGLPYCIVWLIFFVNNEIKSAINLTDRANKLLVISTSLYHNPALCRGGIPEQAECVHVSTLRRLHKRRRKQARVHSHLQQIRACI